MAEQQILGTKKPQYQKPRKISFKVIKPPLSLGGGKIEKSKSKTPVKLGGGDIKPKIVIQPPIRLGGGKIEKSKSRSKIVIQPPIKLGGGKIEKTPSKTPVIKQTLEEQERQLEKRSTQLKPQYKTKVDSSLEVQNTSFTSTSKPISNMQVKAMGLPKLPKLPELKTDDIFNEVSKYANKNTWEKIKSVPLSSSKMPTTVPLPKWLAPISQGKETFTPTIGTLYSLTGIPYVKEELNKIDTTGKFGAKGTGGLSTSLSPYTRSIAGLNPLNLMAETFGLKGTTPVMSRAERDSKPFGDMFFVPADRQKKVQELWKEVGSNLAKGGKPNVGTPTPERAFALAGTIWRPIDLVLTATMAKGAANLVKNITKPITNPALSGALKTKDVLVTTLDKRTANKLTEKAIQGSFLRQVSDNMLGSQNSKGIYFSLTDAERKLLSDPAKQQVLRERLYAVGTELAKQKDAKFYGGQTVPDKNVVRNIKNNLTDFLTLVEPQDRFKLEMGINKLSTKQLNEIKKIQDYKATGDIAKYENEFKKLVETEKRRKEYVSKKIEEGKKSYDSKEAERKALANRIEKDPRYSKDLQESQLAFEKEQLDIRRKQKAFEDQLKKAEEAERKAKKEAFKIKVKEGKTKNFYKKEAQAKKKAEIKQKLLDENPDYWTLPFDERTTNELITPKPKDIKPLPKKSKGDLGTEQKTPGTLKQKEKPTQEEKFTKPLSPKEIEDLTKKPNAKNFNNILDIPGIKLYGNQKEGIAISDQQAEEPTYTADVEKQEIVIRKIPDSLITQQRASDPWKEISDGKSYGIKFGKKGKGEEERASDPFEDVGGGYGYVYDDKTGTLKVKKTERASDPFEDVGGGYGMPMPTKPIPKPKPPKTKPETEEEKKDKDDNGDDSKPKPKTKKAPEKIEEGKKETPKPDDKPEPKLEEEKTKVQPRGKLDTRKYETKKTKSKKLIDLDSVKITKKTKNPKNYPNIVTWQQGNQYPIANLLTNKIKYTTVRPRNLPKGNTVKDTFKILKSSPKKPKKRGLDIGKFFATISQGGVSFQLKRKRKV
tara:strand:- start:1821 stop:4967 length:3147 start_codon:yes stop_codon:yes gene_type:complete